jgi:hypothetical protein
MVKIENLSVHGNRIKELEEVKIYMENAGDIIVD